MVYLLVKWTSRRLSWAYVGEWENGKAHGRGKYTEYDQEHNKVLNKCDGTFEHGNYVGTCNKAKRHSDAISTYGLLIHKSDLSYGCNHSNLAASGDELIPF